MKHLLGLAAIALLAGCSHSVTTTPPPPPALTGVRFTWTGPGNALGPCPDGVVAGALGYGPCNLDYSLGDKNSGALLAQVAVGNLFYQLAPAPAAGAHNYGLWVNILEPDGSVAQSAVALTAVTIP